MERKYTSLAQIDKDLKVLKLKKDIDVLCLKSDYQNLLRKLTVKNIFAESLSEFKEAIFAHKKGLFSLGMGFLIRRFLRK